MRTCSRACVVILLYSLALALPVPWEDGQMEAETKA